MAEAADSLEVGRLVRALPLFARLDPGELAQVAELLSPVELARGQRLFTRGAPARDLWVLGAPSAVEVFAGAAGEGMPLGVLQGGETLGEMALIQGSAHSLTAVVEHPGPAWRMAGAAFGRLRAGGAAVAFKMLRKMAFDLCLRVRQVTARVAAFEAAPVSAPAPVDFAGATAVEPSELDLFPVFRGAPGTVRLALEQMLRERTVERGEVVMREGDPGRALYCVASGELMVRWRWRAVARLKPGSIVGLLSLVDGGSATASAAAARRSRIWRLAAEDFELLYGASHPFAHALVEMVARGLVARLKSANAALGSQGAGLRKVDDALALAEFHRGAPLEARAERDPG